MLIPQIEQGNEQRRDILPIVYDVQSIPTIGGSTQQTRGFPGRQRPFISSKYREVKTRMVIDLNCQF